MFLFLIVFIFQMSVNLQMSQAMNVKMGGGGPSRMASNPQMVPQQQQQPHPPHPPHAPHPQHPQHHHQPQQPQTPQQHPSMMRAQQQQSFTQQTTMNAANPYQRNMGPGYGANPHQQQQYQQPNTAMQSTPVANASTMLNTNNGPPPRNSFSPSDFNFDFLDQPLANDSKNGFNNKQQSFGDFNFDFLDAH